jgi:hypothetical protein
VKKNVILLVLARSGSSMITSIFQAHGFALGASSFVNPAGYRTYENLEIRSAVNAICRVDMDDPVCTKSLKSGYLPSQIRSIFKRLLPNNARWCYKAGIHDWEIMQLSFPDSLFVGVRRNTESVIKSTFQKHNLSLDAAEIRVRAQQKKLDTVTRNNGFPVVDADAVVDGDFTTLEAAFDYCGLVIDLPLVYKMIDRKQWTF